MSPVAALLLPLLISSALASSSPSRYRHRDLARSVGSTSKRALDTSPPLGGFKTVGDSGVSAQMMFLGTEGTVFILDKTENNSMTVDTSTGTRPAWGTSYDLSTNIATPMSVTSNTFCAAGYATGDGTWAVFGGNQPVTYEGVAVNDAGKNPGGANPYGNTDGGEAIRTIVPCDGGSCEYNEGGPALTMTGKRWYPTVEGLGDGSVIVIGGDKNGGYVSTQVQNNPTYEFWPHKSGAINMDFLTETVPLNLFPLTWLLPSGKLFMQAAYKTIIYDMDTKKEKALPDMPYAVRVYPASAASVMLPLTPADNYNPTVLFCGGSSAPMNTSSDGGSNFNVTAYAADASCVRITPDNEAPEYEDDDSLPEPRSMGSFIYMPDGKLWLGNGVGMGTAGYGDENWSFGQSYGQEPVYMPVIYDPLAPSGSRFSRTGLTASPHERMYHSSATLLPDGSIIVSGSNPNKDVTTTKWGTSYVVEKWYPSWYSETRPEPSAWPDKLSYGGDMFNVTYTPAASSDPSNAKVIIIRPGFSTHAINFGQRYLELMTSYTKSGDTSEVTLHASQMPPNPNIFQPGPAMIFLVVDGIPSIGKIIMIGSGTIETQPLLNATVLPTSSVLIAGQTESNDTGSMTAAAGSEATNISGSATQGAASTGTKVSCVGVLGALAVGVLVML